MSYRHKMKDLTDNIRKHRELLGYSQGKMAELLDVSRPFYCQVETGKRILSLKRLIQISDIFNVTLDVLTKPRTIVAPDPTDQSENQTDQSENTLNEILNTYGNRGFEANKTKKEPPDEQDQEHRDITQAFDELNTVAGRIIQTLLLEEGNEKYTVINRVCESINWAHKAQWSYEEFVKDGKLGT